MKLEVGDKVQIKNHWQRVSQSDQLKEMGIENLERYLHSDDMAGEEICLDKYKKVPSGEFGFIAGKRIIKVNYTMWHVYQDEIDVGVGIMPEVDEISQKTARYEEIYLVATRMNCLRRVSFKDIQYLGGEDDG